LEELDDALVTVNGPIIFFCSGMVVFIDLLNSIVSEKENKVRYSMEMMGLKKSAYWVSWIVYYGILFFVNTVATIVFGRIFGYAFFVNTDIMVLLLTFYGYSLAMEALGLFISSLVNRSKVADILFNIFIKAYLL